MYVRFGKQFYRRTYIRFNDNTFYGKRADWNTTPFVKLWLNATIASYRYEFGKNQWKYSVKINWLDRVYNKKYCMFHYCKFCVTHINKIYDKLMDIYVCAFFEIWLLKICQHTTAPQLSNTPKHHSMPCSIKGWFAHIYQYPTPSLHGPRLHFPSSLFIEHQPFRIWISVLFLNLDFSSLFFLLHLSRYLLSFIS